MSKDEILAQLPEMSIEDLSAIKHAANKLMYERNQDNIDALVANPSSVLDNIDKLHLPQELRQAIDMNKEAILTAYGVMKSLNLITETGKDDEPKS